MFQAYLCLHHWHSFEGVAATFRWWVLTLSRAGPKDITGIIQRHTTVQKLPLDGHDSTQYDKFSGVKSTSRHHGRKCVAQAKGLTTRPPASTSSTGTQHLQPQALVTAYKDRQNNSQAEGPSVPRSRSRCRHPLVGGELFQCRDQDHGVVYSFGDTTAVGTMLRLKWGRNRSIAIVSIELLRIMNWITISKLCDHCGGMDRVSTPLEYRTNIASWPPVDNKLWSIPSIHCVTWHSLYRSKSFVLFYWVMARDLTIYERVRPRGLRDYK